MSFVRFVKDWNISIKYGATYLPFTNECYKRNHYFCGIVGSKLVGENDKLTIQDACYITAWTHNTNKSRKGFLPLQLLTGEVVTFP